MDRTRRRAPALGIPRYAIGRGGLGPAAGTDAIIDEPVVEILEPSPAIVGRLLIVVVVGGGGGVHLLLRATGGGHCGVDIAPLLLWVSLCVVGYGCGDICLYWVSKRDSWTKIGRLNFFLEYSDSVLRNCLGEVRFAE